MRSLRPLYCLQFLCRAAAAAGLSAGLLASSPSQAADSPTLRRIRDTGVIVLGYRAESPPFSYLDERLKPIGYSVELCERVIRHLKRRLDLSELEIKLVAVNSATRLPLVANGSLDMECGSTTHTAERARKQSFSLTTFVAGTKLLSRRNSPVLRIEDLRGRSVASTIGTTSVRYLDTASSQRGLNIRILLGQDDHESFRLLQTGQAAAFMMDDVLLATQVAQASNGDSYRLSDEVLTVEPYAIGLPPRDPGFKRLVDEALRAVYASGEIHAIYERWFLSPIPPKGINLRLPMSAAFQRVVKQPTDSPDPERYR